MEDRKKLNFLYLSAGSAAIILTLLLGTSIQAALFNDRSEKELANLPKADPFTNLQLEARAAIVYDIEKNEVVYAKEAETQLPLASLTKTMTAWAASKLMPAGTIVTITDVALETSGDSGFKRGEEWRLGEMVDYMLVTSSNDGARAIGLTAETLAKKRFVDVMNAEATRLGLSQTYFRNETGLDLGPAQPGAFGSAYDVAKLFGHILRERPEILAASSQSVVRAASLERNYFGSNTNGLAAVMPGLLGSKTGYTELAGGNLAVVVDAGLRQPYVIVVMGSSQEGRFSDVQKLTTALNRLINI